MPELIEALITNSSTDLTSHTTPAEGSPIARAVALVKPLYGPRLTRVLPSAVTTDWKVRWDEDMIARDLMQNFRDANSGNFKKISVTAIGADSIVVSGPAQFNVAHLYFLGSSKSKEAGDVGGFGEGFKTSAVCLLRDHGVTPVVVSGGKGVQVRISETTVVDSSMRPLEYQFFDVAQNKPGTFLILQGVGLQLRAAMLRSLDWFFDASHPALGHETLLESPDVDVYTCVHADGLAFYQGLLCARLHGLPVVINYKAACAPIDKTYATDRDRKLFNTKQLDTYYGKIARHVGKNLDSTCKLLFAAKRLWQEGSGHPLLNEVSQYTKRNGLSSAVGATVFGDHLDRFFCENESHGGWEDVSQLVRDWTKEHQIKLPDYFTNFGVKSAGSIVAKQQAAQRVEQEALAKREQQQHAASRYEIWSSAWDRSKRKQSKLESDRIRVIQEAYDFLAADAVRTKGPRYTRFNHTERQIQVHVLDRHDFAMLGQRWAFNKEQIAVSMRADWIQGAMVQALRFYIGAVHQALVAILEQEEKSIWRGKPLSEADCYESAFMQLETMAKFQQQW